MENLQTTYLGLKLRNPLIAGSCGLTNSIDNIKELANKGVGAIVVKSIFEEQINVVTQTLSDIKAVDKPIILVFNKIDAYTFIQKEEDDLTPRKKENLSFEELKNSWMGKTDHINLFISATKKINIEQLRETLYNEVKKIHIQRYPGDHFLY